MDWDKKYRHIFGHIAWVLAFLCGFAHTVQGTSLTWDGDGVTAGLQDGGGNWDTTSVNRWWGGANYQFWNNANNDTAVFGVGTGAATNIALQVAISVGEIIFDPVGSGFYTIKQSNSGRELSLVGSNPKITANADANISATITGSDGLVKEGGATLTLSGSTSYPNTYLGVTTVNAGTLLLAKSAGVISIPGDLIINSNATVRLGNRNQIYDTATIIITGGTLDLTTFAEIAGTVILDGGSILATSGLLSNTLAHSFDFRSGNITAKLSGPAGLIKSSAGSITLAATNNYIGDTLINGGVLSLSGNGSIASSNIMIAAGAYLAVTNRADGSLNLLPGQTLRGVGILEGNVTANPLAVIAPGDVGGGALTIHGGLTLNAGSTTIMKLNGDNNDAVTGMTKISYGGTLMITNIGSVQSGGEVYRLFSAATYSNAFNSIIWPDLSPGLAWSNQLAQNGSISVVVTNVLTPTMGFTKIRQGGGLMEIRYFGPAGQTYQLWSGTNMAAVPITNSWGVLTNGIFSGSEENYPDALIPGRQQRFYLITSP